MRGAVAFVSLFASLDGEDLRRNVFGLSIKDLGFRVAKVTRCLAIDTEVNMLPLAVSSRSVISSM